MSKGTGLHGPTAHADDCECVRCTGFEKGNTLAVTHGAYSRLRLEPRAREIRQELEEVAPLVSPADGPLIDLAAGLLAQSERGLLVLALSQAKEVEALQAGQPYDGEARQTLSRLSHDCRGWISTAMRALDSLGCSPTSRARLGLDLVRAQAVQEHALDQLAEEGRRLRLAADAEAV